ncbi:MAG: polysaccharide deacetylase family protein [Gammaproteobacteria bacterium]|nr:polysaccharide deacetylase family protein [Gammaproteobacteria bacterium]
MKQLARIVVFAGDLSYPVCKNIVAIEQALPDQRWLILVHTPRRTPGQRLRRHWKLLRRHGWRHVPHVCARLRSRWQSPCTPDGESAPGGEFTLQALQASPRVVIREMADLHGADVLKEVRRFAPDLGLSLGAPILRRTLFDIPRLGTLNLHKGKLPDYRGMPPVFWELWNGEATVGCTVHWMEEALDAGPIAAESTLEVDQYATVKGLLLRLDELGISLVRDVVLDVAAGRMPRRPQPARGHTFRRPTLAQVASLERRLAARLPVRASLPKTLVKQWIRHGVFTAALVARRHVALPKVTVLLYHRVTDAARDNLSTGIEQFDRQMALLRRHFRVLSLPQLLRLGRVPMSDRPLACVTFDDGYLDNYVHAVPILTRHRIPAAFFVATGFIDSTRQFPHDIRRGNAFIPLMTWDQLREMHAAGFTIGSHTVNHIDCAAEPEARVRAELEASRATLVRELGLEEIIFSYPYGGRQHITPERLEWVKQAGYAGCVSAYGGINAGAIDRWDVKRRGVHWEFADASFLYTAYGF